MLNPVPDSIIILTPPPPPTKNSIITSDSISLPLGMSKQEAISILLDTIKCLHCGNTNG